MLIIKPVQKNEQENICRACGVGYREREMAYAAREDEKLLGVCTFYMSGDTGYVTALRCVDGVDDFEALFIMGRQTLNFIDLCGVHKAVFLGEESRITKAVGFKMTDGRLFMDLDGFFESPCSHDK